MKIYFLLTIAFLLHWNIDSGSCKCSNKGKTPIPEQGKKNIKLNVENSKKKKGEKLIEEGKGKKDVRIKYVGNEINAQKVDDEKIKRKIIYWGYTDCTVVFKIDFKETQSKEAVKGLQIKNCSTYYDSQPYMLALVEDYEKNKYIIFCKKANSKFHNGTNCGLFRNTSIRSVTIYNAKNLENIECLFYQCQHLSSVNIINFDTEKLTKISFMFAQCRNLKLIDDLEKLNFKNVTNADNMFCECDSILKIKIVLGNKIKNMFGMFYNCTKLKVIEVNNFKYCEDLNIRNIIDGSYDIEKFYINIGNNKGIDKFLKKLGKNFSYDNKDCVFINKTKVKSDNSKKEKKEIKTKKKNVKKTKDESSGEGSDNESNNESESNEDEEESESNNESESNEKKKTSVKKTVKKNSKESSDDESESNNDKEESESSNES